MKHVPVIGLEVHVELNTKTKMFCRCASDYFGKEPNTKTCPVCLGLPAVPYPNEEALKKCIQIGLALGCKISDNSFFERKNYFYPDLPKGYQISQYRWPLCKDGLCVVGSRKVRINRVHMEEDTGKLMHAKDGTLIDLNRAGVPLVEIVTEPDFRSSGEVYEFAKKLQQILKALDVSNADMEKGDLRLEANVSVRSESATELPPYRVELKNINSFRFMKHAIDYEVSRQTELLLQGVALKQETRGWDEDKRASYLQRTKEEAHDYRYFPDPDLPPLVYSSEVVERIRSEMNKLPDQEVERLVNTYSLPPSSAGTLVRQGMADYFETAAQYGINRGVPPVDLANVIINKKVDVKVTPPGELVEDVKMKKEQLELSEQELEKIATEVVETNAKAVRDYKEGKENALQFLIGQVMAKTLGHAVPDKIRKVILSKI